MRLDIFRNWAIAAPAWALLVTASLAWPLLFPHVDPMAASFREDTFGLEMFDMQSDTYPIVEKAAADGRLVVTDLSDGFRLFTRPSLSRLQRSRRVVVAQQIVDNYLAEQRWRARMPWLAAWAGLVILPLGALGAAAIWTASARNRRQPAALEIPTK